MAHSPHRPRRWLDMSEAILDSQAPTDSPADRSPAHDVTETDPGQQNRPY